MKFQEPEQKPVPYSEIADKVKPGDVLKLVSCEKGYTDREGQDLLACNCTHTASDINTLKELWCDRVFMALGANPPEESVFFLTGGDLVIHTPKAAPEEEWVTWDEVPAGAAFRIRTSDDGFFTWGVKSSGGTECFLLGQWTKGIRTPMPSDRYRVIASPEQVASGTFTPGEA